MSCDCEPFQILTNSSMPSSSIVDRPIEWLHRDVIAQWDRTRKPRLFARPRRSELGRLGWRPRAPQGGVGRVERRHFADSARESIHAVESVDFSKALAKLEARTDIHGGLKRGFTATYGFTSDQQGIRDALLEKDVDQAPPYS